MKQIGSSIFPLIVETLASNLPGVKGEGQPHGVLGMEEEDGFEGRVIVVELEFDLVDVVLEVVGEHALQHLFLLFGRELGVVQQLLEHTLRKILIIHLNSNHSEYYRQHHTWLHHQIGFIQSQKKGDGV